MKTTIFALIASVLLVIIFTTVSTKPFESEDLNKLATTVHSIRRNFYQVPRRCPGGYSCIHGRCRFNGGRKGRIMRYDSFVGKKCEIRHFLKNKQEQHF